MMEKLLLIEKRIKARELHKEKRRECEKDLSLFGGE